MSYPGDRFIYSDHSSTLVLFFSQIVQASTMYMSNGSLFWPSWIHTFKCKTWSPFWNLGKRKAFNFSGSGGLIVLVGDVDHHPCLWEPFWGEGSLAPTLTGPQLLCSVRPCVVSLFVLSCYVIHPPALPCGQGPGHLSTLQPNACFHLEVRWKQRVQLFQTLSMTKANEF